MKGLVRKTIQNLYRHAAPPDFSLFEYSDVQDPFFGEMSGTPIDRILIEKFLLSACIDLNLEQGSALEIGSVEYISKYWPKLASYELKYLKNRELYSKEPNLVEGDLQLQPLNFELAFNLICLTQVFPFIENLEEAVSSLKKILSLDGYLVGTVPFLMPVSIYDESRWGEWHRFTERSLRKLLRSQFKDENIQIKTIGNAKTSSASILGIPSELIIHESNFDRPSHSTLIGFIVKNS